MTDLGAVPALHDSEIEADVKTAKERYVQAGLKLNVTIEDPVTVPATVMVDDQSVPVDLTDGLDFPALGIGARPPLLPEEEAFLATVASSSTDDIEVFYIDHFSDVGSGNQLNTEGFAYTDDSPGFDPGQFANTIILTRDASTYVLAHELGHVLAHDSSHAPDPENLMSAAGSGDNNHKKRLSSAQEAAILSSDLLDE